MTGLDGQIKTKVAQQISQISGVALVNIGGQRSRRSASRRPGQIATRGLSLEDVRAQIVARASTARKARSTALRLRSVPATRTTAKEWNDVIIAYRLAGQSACAILELRWLD